MLKKEIFKAYDVRGRYPAEINEEVVGEISAALAGYFGKGLVVVGHDARLSSPRLYRRAAAALRGKKSLKVREVGMITTPQLYFLVNYFSASGGLVITASHNPPEYNGMKIVKKGATPISGGDIRKIVMKHKTRSK